MALIDAHCAAPVGWGSTQSNKFYWKRVGRHFIHEPSLGKGTAPRKTNRRLLPASGRDSLFRDRTLSCSIGVS
jgi:hypothetical protein